MQFKGTKHIMVHPISKVFVPQKSLFCPWSLTLKWAAEKTQVLVLFVQSMCTVYSALTSSSIFPIDQTPGIPGSYKKEFSRALRWNFLKFWICWMGLGEKGLGLVSNANGSCQNVNSFHPWPAAEHSSQNYFHQSHKVPMKSARAQSGDLICMSDRQAT